MEAVTQQTTRQKAGSQDLKSLPEEPPNRSGEEMSLEIDLNTIKGSPLDQESLPSIVSDDDSQHSSTTSHHDEVERTVPGNFTPPGTATVDRILSVGLQQKPAKLIFRCSHCSKVFQKRSRLVSHEIVHSNEKDYICGVCGKGFKNKPQLQRHSNTHSTVPNFCCNICGRGFKHNDVAKHIRRFHTGPRKSRRGGVANPNAPINSPYNTPPHLTQNSHQPHQQFILEQNHQNFHHQTEHSVFHQSQLATMDGNQAPVHHQIQQSVIQIQPHQNMIHLDQQHEGVIHQVKEEVENKFNLLPGHDISNPQSLEHGMSHLDSFSGSSNDSLQVCPARVTHQEYPCTQCSLSFATHSELTSHLVTHSKCKTGKKEHQCHLCHKTFTRASGLTGHMQLHTRTERRREPNPDLSCPMCGKMFTRRAGLNAHVLQHEGVLRFWCDEPDCGKGFVHSYQLVRHKRIHSDVLPYTCDVCGRSFRHNDLSKHMRTHTGDKPYNCQHCGKAFASSSSLRTHERMHLALKEHICEICDMGFTTSAGLRRHGRMHDNEKDELCSSCGKFFPSKLHLSLHMQDSQHCSQQPQLHHQPSQMQPVLPVSHVEQQVQQLPQNSMHKAHGMHDMHIDVQQPHTISSQISHDVVPLQLVHQVNTATLTTLAVPDSLVSDHSQSTANNVDALPLLVPFPVSVPISVPFSVNINPTSSDQIQLNHFLSWEQKY